MPSRSLAVPSAVLVVVAVGLVAGLAFGSPAAIAKAADAPGSANAGFDSSADTIGAGESGSPSAALADGTTSPLVAGAALASADSTTQGLGPWNVTWTVTLRPSGDAEWEVAMTVPVEDESDEAAFEDVAADFEAGSHSLGLETFEYAAANASRATDREMSVEDPARDHAIRDGTGELVLEFTWTSFAEWDSERLVVDDAFLTRDGTWLSPIPAGWALVIAPPEGYNIVEAPEVVNRTARWDGPFDFTADPPRVVFSGERTPTATPGGPTTTSPGGPGTTPGTPTAPGSPGGTTPGGADPGGFPSVLAIVAMAALAAMTAALLAAYARRDDPDAGLSALVDFGGDDAGGASADSATSASGADTDSPASPTDSSTDASESSGDGPGDAAAGAAGAAGASAAGLDDDVDEELLSDEERVERLLDRNGGRMKQANIVKETGWSNAKVSQLLSSMDDADRIDKLRIGRENLISFPDEDVTDVDSE